MTQPNDIDLMKLCQKLSTRVKELESRISDIEGRFSPVVEDRMALFLTVPDTIRKSLLAVSQLERCTADDVSVITERHRSIENKYLNELVRAGWLERERIGKKIYYYLKKTSGSPKTEYQSAVDELDEKLDQLLG